MKPTQHKFSAEIKIIGINPYVSVPESILKSIFLEAKRDKGPIQIRGFINQKPYLQTLVKYAGEWRLYINTKMLEQSPKRIGEKIEVVISFDPEERIIEMHPALKEAIDNDRTAKSVFERLPPSRQKEIVRYISHLKSEEKIKENISRAINFLLGIEKFAGREKP
ncbi:MAG: YdeI/OmpD-associated family protein [Chitinophagaceae bacterium]